MTNLNIRVLKLKILEALSIKSKKKIKPKIKNFMQLESFITVASPFIFHHLFIKEKNSKEYFITETIILIKKILKIIKLIFIFLLKKIFTQKIKIEDKIFFFSNRITDQYNVFPLSNYLLKKKINHTVLFNGKKEVLTEIKKKFNKQIFQISDYLSIFDFIFGYINYLTKKKYIIKIFNIFNFNNKERKKIYFFYLYFFIYRQLFKRIIKNNKIEFVLADKFNSPEICSLIYYLRHEKQYKNFSSISYYYTGTGGESGLYIHSNSDIVLTPSKDDSDILNQLKKKNLTFLTNPLPITIGSARNEIVKKKYYKKKNKKIKILFIKSNSQHYNNLDNKALRMFVSTIKKFKNKIDFKIKDRYQGRSPIIKHMLRENLISDKNIADTKELFVEKFIIDSDICIGTCTSALTKQAYWLNTPTIQLFKNNIIDQFGPAVSANNEKELEFVFKKFLKKNYFKKKINEVKKFNKKSYLKYKNPSYNFYKYIIKS